MKNLNKVLVAVLATLATISVHAQEAVANHAAAVVDNSLNKGMIAIAAAIAIGIAVYGGTSAQGKTATAALEGIARNPVANDKIFTPMILGLALIESLVILAFIIAFLVIPKL